MCVSNDNVPCTNYFVCVFGPSPAPRLFTKLMKVPISILLEDFIILVKTLEEAILNRDTVIYLLKNLGYVINLKKSLFHPTQRIEFLAMIIDLADMTVSLSQEKVESISKRFQDIYCQCRRCQ